MDPRKGDPRDYSPIGGRTRAGSRTGQFGGKQRNRGKENSGWGAGERRGRQGTAQGKSPGGLYNCSPRSGGEASCGVSRERVSGLDSGLNSSTNRHFIV